MITKIQSYSTESGVFRTIEEAQKAELMSALRNADGADKKDEQWYPWIADTLIRIKPEILDILTTTPNSKPSARKINGGTKKRKAAAMDAAINRSVQDNKQ